MSGPIVVVRIARTMTRAPGRAEWVRRVLAAELAAPVADVEIDRSCEWCGNRNHGKPRIWGVSENELSFSLSNSNDVLLLAIARGAIVGADIERVRAIPDALVDLACSPAEHAIVHERAGHERAEIFFRLWVRKEAVLKARGCGLIAPPSADQPKNHLALALDDAGWATRSVAAPPGFVAAIATDRVVGDIRTQRFDELPAEFARRAPA